MKKQEYDIVWLLSNKDYHNLAPDEREFVESLMSEGQYNSLRETSLLITDSLQENEIEPGEGDLEKLSVYFDKTRPKRTPLLIKAFTYRMPAYAAAIAALLFVTLFFSYPSLLNPAKTVYLKPDTVFVEKIVYQESPPQAEPEEAQLEKAVIIKKADRKKELPRASRTVRKEETIDLYAGNAIMNMINTQSKSKGSSLGEDSLTGRFLVTVH